MDRDKDARLTFDEFVEGSKQDPTIVQVRSSWSSAPHAYFVSQPLTFRRSHSTTDLYNLKLVSKFSWIAVVMIVGIP